MGKDGEGDSSSDSNSPKRSRSIERDRKSRRKDLSSGSGDMQSLSADIISQLSHKLDEVKLDLSREFKSELKAELKGVKKDISSIKSTVESHDTQLGDHDRAITQILETQKQHDAAMAKSVQEAAKSARECAASMSPPVMVSPPPVHNAFDRPPNPCVIQANVHGNGLFAKQELKNVLMELLGRKGLECDFEIPGKEVARKFAVTCKGPVGQEMVATLLRARKVAGTDEWAYIPIKDPEGKEVKLYFGPDKSPKVARTEAITRKFAAHLRQVYGTHSFGERREEGIITMDGTRVAFIEVQPTKNTLQWNAPALHASSIQKDEMAAHFEKTFNIQWSS